ncbi:MAG: YggT family protein [Clostridia bacterium]|nr:YggT family protein [Clostridia bacterium]
MHVLALILSRMVLATILIVELCMLARMILQFFVEDENALMTFCIAVTEPVILPFRLLFSRFESLDRIPFDIPFIVAYFSLAILGRVLPVVS